MFRGLFFAATLVAMHFNAQTTTVRAETPLVVAELEACQKIAAAELQRALAEQELANWKLAKLQELRSKQHASWQEVAEQEVVTHAATARAQAAERFLEVVLNQQRLLALGPLDLVSDTECIRLYAPRSVRLTAWIPVEFASNELCRQHLEQLRSELKATEALDLSSWLADIKTAEGCVAKRVRSVADSDCEVRDMNRLRLARANYDLAQALEENARLISRRMELTTEALDRNADDEPTSALAQAGTRFVDMTSDRELTRRAQLMLADQRLATTEIASLKHEFHTVSDRVIALETLTQKHTFADPSELLEARQLQAELARDIAGAQESLALTQQLAGEYQETAEMDFVHDDSPTALSACEPIVARDASSLRHSLELMYLRLHMAADRASASARHRYLQERLRRVEGIAEENGRPNELPLLRHSVEGARLDLEIADHRLLQLGSEQQRLACQFESQQRDTYQLIQLADGQFITREQMEQHQALIVTVGILGHVAPFLPRTVMLPYVESKNAHQHSSRLSGYSFDATSSPMGQWQVDNSGFSRRNTVTSVCRSTLPSSVLTGQWPSYPSDLFCPLPYGSLRTIPYYQRVSDRWLPYRRPPYRAETLSHRAAGIRPQHELYQDRPMYQRDILLLKYGRWSPNTHRSQFYYDTIVTFSDPFARPYTRSPYHRTENYLETRYLNRTHQSR